MTLLEVFNFILLKVVLQLLVLKNATNSLPELIQLVSAQHDGVALIFKEFFIGTGLLLEFLEEFLESVLQAA